MTLKAKPGDGDFGIKRVDRIKLLQSANPSTGEHEVAEFILDALEEAGYTLYRKRVFTQARREASTVECTPEIAAQVREHARIFSGKSQLELANHFNINPGRVSEALNNLR